MLMVFFLFFSMLLLCSFCEKWCNYVVTFFFLKMPKIWVGRTTVNGEKKEDGFSYLKILYIKE